MNANETTSRWSGNGKWFLIGGMILIFIIIVAVFDPSGGLTKKQNTQNTDTSSDPSAKYSPVILNTLASVQPLVWMKTGPEKAPVNIVVFFDFTCVHCLASWPAIRTLATGYGDKVHLILRDRTPTNESLNLAIAGHCAGEQGKFWEIFDIFYQNQSANLGADINKVSAIGKQIGLDESKFNDCLRSDTYKKSIAADMAKQEKLGINGTPTWFVNGEKLEGEMTVQEADNIVQTVLNNLK